MKKQAVRVDLWERMQFAKAAQRERMAGPERENEQDEVKVRKLDYNPENEVPHCAHPKKFVWTKKKSQSRQRYAKFKSKGAPTMQTNDIIPPGS